MATISKLKIAGFRTLEKLELDLEGLSVLIGVNGSGKSSILEALEILRLVGARSGDFLECFSRWHGGRYGTFRRAPGWVDQMMLGVEVREGEQRIGYELTFVEQNGYDAIGSESLTLDGTVLLERRAGDVGAYNGKLMVAPNKLVLPQLAPTMPAALTMASALGNVDVHLPFFTMPRWAARESGMNNPMREPAAVGATPQRLDLFGMNFIQSLHELRSGGSAETWRDTMELVRLGLGQGIDDLRFRTAEQGVLNLEIRLRGVGPDISIHSLSDGQLAYLALVAMFQLDKHHAGYFGARSLLAFDEPDLHLHPAAIARVVLMFEEAAGRHSVVIATQSDALLDGLTDPASSVRVCELDEVDWRTSVQRLDPDALKTWLAKYRGRLGALRADGNLSVVVQ